MSEYSNAFYESAVINDPAVAYASRQYQAHSSISGEALSGYDMIEIVRKGLDKRTIYRLADLLGINLDQICDLIHISTRTLQRKGEFDSLGPLISERALDLALVVVQGVNALGSLAVFQSWLKSPRPALGGLTPLSLLDTTMGCEMVGDVLGRIEHGIHS